MAIMEMHQLLEKSITRNHQHIYEVERRKIPKPWEDPLGLRFHISLQTSDSVKLQLHIFAWERIQPQKLISMIASLII
jgi:hypothetical protein